MTDWSWVRDRETEEPSITLGVPRAGELCSDLAHTRAGIAAAVVARFGRMPWLKWSDCSGKSFPMCSPCWDRTRSAAEQMIPDIKIHTLMP